GEHVSLVGPNGTGKTTLIETLAGGRELAAGRLSVGHNVRIGYLSQHDAELGAGGPAEQSVLDATQRATGLTPGKARALLGRFLFSGEEAEKPLEVLSGGERRRLSLAILIGSPAPPTVPMLDAGGTRTVAFEEATLRSYVGGWPEYVRVREERAARAPAKPKRMPAPK